MLKNVPFGVDKYKSVKILSDFMLSKKKKFCIKVFFLN